MSSINNCNKKEENKNINEDHKKNQRSAFRDNFFNLDIKDDIYDPFKDDFFGFDSFENKIFRNFRNIFKIFDEKKETEKPKEVEEVPKEIKSEDKMEEEKEEEKEEEEINTNTKEEEINTNTKEEEINTNTKEEEINTNTKEEEINTNTKEEEINTNTKEEEINTNTKEEEKMEEEEIKPKKENIILSKIYKCSYNNINGKEEKYTSESINQKNNEHNISEIKETYKNSNGIYKSSYQRGLDDKITRYIKEKNMKTGKKNQKKIIKGLEENEINDFNKTYNDICKQCGFKKQFKEFDPFGINRKHLLSDGMNNLFFHKLLF